MPIFTGDFIMDYLLKITKTNKSIEVKTFKDASELVHYCEDIFDMEFKTADEFHNYLKDLDDVFKIFISKEDLIKFIIEYFMVEYDFPNSKEKLEAIKKIF